MARANKEFAEVYVDVDDVCDNLYKLRRIQYEKHNEYATELFGVDPEYFPEAYNITFGYKRGGIQFPNELKPTADGMKYLEELYELLIEEFNY
jgi:hypothetical protein